MFSDKDAFYMNKIFACLLMCNSHVLLLCLIGGGCLSVSLSVRGDEEVGYPPSSHFLCVTDDNLAYGPSWWYGGQG